MSPDLKNMPWSEVPIRELMHRANKVLVDASLESALLKLQDSQSHCVLVVDDKDHLKGIFREEDVLNRVLGEDFSESSSISEFMQDEVFWLNENSSVANVIDIMGQRHLRYLPLCNDDGEVTGLFSIRELIFHLSEKYQEILANDHLQGDHDLGHMQDAIIQVFKLPISFSLSRHGYNEVKRLSIGDTVVDALERLKGTVQSAALVFNEGELVGLFKVRDVPFKLLKKNAGLEEMPVNDLMTEVPSETKEDETLGSGIVKMAESNTLFLYYKNSEVSHGLITGRGLISYLYAHIYEDD